MSLELRLPHARRVVDGGLIRTAVAGDAADVMRLCGRYLQTAAAAMGMPVPGTTMCMTPRGALVDMPCVISYDRYGRINACAFAITAGRAVRSAVCVRPDCRQRGVGQKVCRALLVYLATLGFEQVLVRITLPNVAAVALHTAVGYVPVVVYEAAAGDAPAAGAGWWARSLKTLP